MLDAVRDHFTSEPKLEDLVGLCRTDLCAEQVWLFGSRARGDAKESSDWDVLAIISDNAPPDIEDVPNAWKVKRRSGVRADLLTVRMHDFLAARQVINTISHAAFTEGVRLDG